MNSCPEAKTRAVKDETLSMRASARRTDSSSSTIAITGDSAIVRFGDAAPVRDSGPSSYTPLHPSSEGEAEDGASLRRIVRPQLPALCLDDRAADCKSQAQALLLAGDEGLEYALELVGCNSVTAIGHRALERGVRGDTGLNQELALERGHLCHGLARIQEEVEHHLLHLHVIALHERDIGTQLHRD